MYEINNPPVLNVLTYAVSKRNALKPASAPFLSAWLLHAGGETFARRGASFNRSCAQMRTIVKSSTCGDRSHSERNGKSTNTSPPFSLTLCFPVYQNRGTSDSVDVTWSAITTSTIFTVSVHDPVTQPSNSLRLKFHVGWVTAVTSS